MNSMISKILKPKIIFLILSVVIVVEIVFAFRALRQPTPSPVPAPRQSKNVVLSGGKISLTSDKTTYKIGDVIPVNISINTGSKKTDGTDALINFDPTLLDTSSSAISKGTIYSDYPVASVNMKDGIVSISGISSAKEGYSGTGLLATIQFRAKAAGQATISVNFKPGLTTDSNMVETGTSKDILEQVSNLTLQIQ